MHIGQNSIPLRFQGGNAGNGAIPIFGDPDIFERALEQARKAEDKTAVDHMLDRYEAAVRSGSPEDIAQSRGMVKATIDSVDTRQF